MAQPFIKWPGGKRWAAPLIARIVRDNLRGTYIEPFLGSGAVFFRLNPKRALLTDINADLINTYNCVKEDPAKLLRLLKAMPVSEKNYYKYRASNPRTPWNKAARFLYLNRTAFGGIYRLNRQGRFNVPFGGGQRTPTILWEQGILAEASKALESAIIEHSDFEAVIEHAGKGDLVYCDPTYTVTHDVNGFIRYNEKNFCWADQERLAKAARRAAKRGAGVLISNAHHNSIEDCYYGGIFYTLERTSRISRKIEGRRPVREYLIAFLHTAVLSSPL